QALEQASLFGNSVVVIRGHADLSKFLQDFVKAGLVDGALKRLGNAGNYTYFWKGDKINLADTKKLIEIVEKHKYSNVRDEDSPKLTLTLLQELSKKRAEAVRDSVF